MRLSLLAEALVDVPRIRATLDRVFTPETVNNLTGKAFSPDVDCHALLAVAVATIASSFIMR